MYAPQCSKSHKKYDTQTTSTNFIEYCINPCLENFYLSKLDWCQCASRLIPLLPSKTVLGTDKNASHIQLEDENLREYNIHILCI